AIREFYEAARGRLKHELLTISERESAAVGDALGAAIRQRSYTCFACAVMPDHVHLLIRKHRDLAEAMIEHLQTASRDAVRALRQRAPGHPVWCGSGWKVYLETRDDMERTVRYI